MTRKQTSVEARRRMWPWIVGGLVVALGGAAVAVGVFATQAFAVRADLVDAKDRLAVVVADARAGGDAASLSPRLDEIAAVTARARATVDTPLWAVFSHIPLVGQNVAAVRDVTEATDILVHDALPVGVKLVGTIDIDNLTLAGGGIDLEPFAAAQSSLPELDDAFSRAQQSVSGIDRSRLLPIVDESIGQVLDVIDTAAPSISLLEQYLPTLLQMAGSEGPRRYLMVFQNLAETRATGGNPAAALVLTVDGGRMSFGDQASSTTFIPTAGTPYLDLPADTLALYEDDTTSYEQNFTRTPDFPTTAALFRSAWQRTTGQDIDGVISVDPVVLTAVLRVTGAVTVSDGTVLTPDDAVRILLSDTYRRFPAESDPADAFFAAAAAAVFDKVVAGGWNPVDMFDQLATAAADQRVYLWFSREGEEAVAQDLGVAGALADPAADGTELGVFVNDSGYDKLGFYLSSSILVSCDVAARTTTTSITVTNAVPDVDLSWYQASNRAQGYGYDRATMFLDILSLAPAGGTIVSSDPAVGDLGWDRAGVDSGRQAWSRTVVVPQGGSRTVTYVSTLPDDATGPISLRHTPGIGDTPVTVDASCDALPPAS